MAFGKRTRSAEVVIGLSEDEFNSLLGFLVLTASRDEIDKLETSPAARMGLQRDAERYAELIMERRGVSA